MSELSIHAARIAISHHTFHNGDGPHFDTVYIETEDRDGAKDLVKVFLSAKDSARLSRAVDAFNAAFEIEEATP